ncbi:MAG: hypothetical protein H9535_21570 [Ignavibacteria bacterium]|nr:hypothetical protein [Ignavibacteria bacterium]
MDTFADAAVSSSSMTDTMTAPQGAVATKKKVKIDALILQDLEVTSFITGENVTIGINMQNSGKTCPQTQLITNQCTACCRETTTC